MDGQIGIGGVGSIDRQWGVYLDYISTLKDLLNIVISQNFTEDLLCKPGLKYMRKVRQDPIPNVA
jgi:hypothetical protein